MRLRSRSGVVGVVGIALGLAASCQALRPPPEPVKPVQRADVANVAAGDRAFAFRLYRVLAERDGNLAFSPAGVRMALTMAWAGAQGETAEELGEVLGVGGDPTAIHQSNQALLAAWSKPAPGASAGFTLRVAQGFFAQTERQAAQPFIELLKRHYAAPFSPKDFASPETVRTQINHWVEERTNDRLASFLAEGSVDVGMELLLVSALDFEATFKQPFEPARTHLAKFERPGGKKVNVSFLSRTGEHLLSETPEAQVVELEYEGDGFVFDVIVPRGDLSKLSAALDEKKLDELLSALGPKEVTLTLPRFRAGGTLDLAAPLDKIGIHAAFARGRADLSGITGTRQLFVSKLPHRINLEVGDGTPFDAKPDAGAAKAPEARGVEVRAARPFLYLVRDKKRNLILAMGRYVEPEAG